MHDFFRDCGLFNKLDLFRWPAIWIWVLIDFLSYPLSKISLVNVFHVLEISIFLEIWNYYITEITILLYYRNYYILMLVYILKSHFVEGSFALRSFIKILSSFSYFTHIIKMLSMNLRLYLLYEKIRYYFELKMKYSMHGTMVRNTAPYSKYKY